MAAAPPSSHTPRIVSRDTRGATPAEECNLSLKLIQAISRRSGYTINVIQPNVPALQAALDEGADPSPPIEGSEGERWEACLSRYIKGKIRDFPQPKLNIAECMSPVVLAIKYALEEDLYQPHFSDDAMTCAKILIQHPKFNPKRLLRSFKLMYVGDSYFRLLLAAVGTLESSGNPAKDLRIKNRSQEILQCLYENGFYSTFGEDLEFRYTCNGYCDLYPPNEHSKYGPATISRHTDIYTYIEALSFNDIDKPTIVAFIRNLDDKQRQRRTEIQTRFAEALGSVNIDLSAELHTLIMQYAWPHLSAQDDRWRVGDCDYVPVVPLAYLPSCTPSAAAGPAVPRVMTSVPHSASERACGIVAQLYANKLAFQGGLKILEGLQDLKSTGELKLEGEIIEIFSSLQDLYRRGKNLENDIEHFAITECNAASAVALISRRRFNFFEQLKELFEKINKYDSNRERNYFLRQYEANYAHLLTAVKNILVEIKVFFANASVEKYKKAPIISENFINVEKIKQDLLGFAKNLDIGKKRFYNLLVEGVPLNYAVIERCLASHDGKVEMLNAWQQGLVEASENILNNIARRQTLACKENFAEFLRQHDRIIEKSKAHIRQQDRRNKSPAIFVEYDKILTETQALKVKQTLLNERFGTLLRETETKQVEEILTEFEKNIQALLGLETALSNTHTHILEKGTPGIGGLSHGTKGRGKKIKKRGSASSLDIPVASQPKRETLPPVPAAPTPIAPTTASAERETIIVETTDTVSEELKHKREARPLVSADIMHLGQGVVTPGLSATPSVEPISARYQLRGAYKPIKINRFISGVPKPASLLAHLGGGLTFALADRAIINKDVMLNSLVTFASGGADTVIEEMVGCFANLDTIASVFEISKRTTHSDSKICPDLARKIRDNLYHLSHTLFLTIDWNNADARAGLKKKIVDFNAYINHPDKLLEKANLRSPLSEMPELMRQLVTAERSDTQIDAKIAAEYFDIVCDLESQVKTQSAAPSLQKHAFSFLHCIGGIFAGIMIDARQTKSTKQNLSLWRDRGNSIRHLDEESGKDKPAPGTSGLASAPAAPKDKDVLDFGDFPPLPKQGSIVSVKPR